MAVLLTTFHVFLFTVCLVLARPIMAQSRQFAVDCSFGKPEDSTSNLTMSATFNGKLAASKYLSHSCVVKTDGQHQQKRFLLVKAKRRKNESNGFLHASVYGADKPQLLGHLDVWKSGSDWSALAICPPRYDSHDQEMQLVLSGTPNLTFKVQIESSLAEIKLNEPKTFRVDPRDSDKNPVVFQFIPEEDISNTQLDITVTSDSDVPAYLKVSRDCKDVKDKIKVVDYKGESLRLSFGRKGRITLSKVSIPPLTDSKSSWFIGIAIKNATGNTPLDVTKYVALELTKSFDYSYTFPVCMLIVSSIAGGVLLSCFAIFCFPITSEASDSQSNHGDNPPSSGTQQSSPRDSNVTEIQTPQPNSSIQAEPVRQSQSTSTPGNQSANYGSTQFRMDEQTPCSAPEETITDDDISVGVTVITQKELTPLIPSSGEVAQQRALAGDSDTHQNEASGCCDICCRVVLHDWFKNGPKTYSYTTGIVGFVLMIGAGQFIFANWHLMIQEGDRDTCYYNDFCYRVSNYDIPLNLMISNLTYMFHGLILAIFVLRYMEVKLFTHKNRNALPPTQAFSIGYAFAWALIFEGFFSLVYHLCPTKLTFQFDTGFMFVIAGLVVILLHNGIGMKENNQPTFIDAANFFLYFIVPLYIFNYLATLSNPEPGLINLTAFYISVALWCIVIFFWTGWKLFPDGSFSEEYIMDNKCKLVCFSLGVIAPVICLSFLRDNLPLGFLVTCIAESVIAIVGVGYYQRKKWVEECRRCRRNTKCECEYCQCCSIKCEKGCCRKVMQVIFIVVMLTLWFVAIYFFLGRPTTDKVSTPEKSRDLNQDCTIFKFFDYHDIWHFCSSHALLMTAYFVMYISNG